VNRLLAIAVGVCVGLPLLFGLREPDMRSDEAIYSYAVERVLDTGDWLTPRSIPSDEAFLEKPPLKTWIVAAGIRSGLLPRNEFGLRFFDGLFGAIAFFYVFAIGRALGGTTCGAVAVLVLFTMAPVVFDHGLRSNNMEASLILCYCGGIFHFWRWMAPGAPARRRGHALAVAGYFALGFMTKFVAALFLPCVCVVALAWRRDAFARLRAGWRDWPLPIGLLVVAISPWFVYQTWQFGSKFWQILFGVHVFTRFTGTLDPDHLHVWHYYVSATWRELQAAGSQTLALGGVVVLGRAAWRAEPGLARLVLVWGVLPLALMSLGTSKLLHYAYPFWPALALAAGFAFSSAVEALDGRLGAWLAPRLVRASTLSRASARRYLAAAGLACAVLAAWTAFVGPIQWDWRGSTIFRSTTLERPVSWSIILLSLSVYGTTPARMVGGVLLAALLPLQAYVSGLGTLGRVDHPLRATAQCVASVQASGAEVGRGVFSASGNILHHSYYYYLWRLGPWTIAPAFSAQEVLDRLAAPAGPTPVILNRADYDTLVQRLSGAVAAPRPAEAGLARSEPLEILMHDTVRYDDNIAVLLPGPYSRCAAPILSAGGRPVWPPRTAGAAR
jgi:4-amino-4-deoxy-L-arabinose transferase-like glycosyltransferase